MILQVVGCSPSLLEEDNSGVIFSCILYLHSRRSHSLPSTILP